jgi:leucyl/phenylalanyl-tRNA---protein transferase
VPVPPLRERVGLRQGCAGRVAVVTPRSRRLRAQLERGLASVRAAGEHAAGKAQRLLGRASTLLTENPMGGTCGIADGLPLNADQMLLGYMQGLFPMDVGGKLRWRFPYPRFALLLDELQEPEDVASVLASGAFELSFDRAPARVLEACRQCPDADWLSERLEQLYLELFELKVMHTVEAWQGGELVGGSFGLSLGRVWTTEARFERAANAADAQFLHLARHLVACGYSCVEAQAYTAAMARFGARDVPVDEYRSLLARGLIAPASFGDPPRSGIRAQQDAPRGGAFAAPRRR